ncbi:MAG: hypothetical protein K8T91_21445 [Planctomycetes bacterium]|nr:hypothetical protein [Planctomycetota bacterium]
MDITQQSRKGQQADRLFTDPDAVIAHPQVRDSDIRDGAKICHWYLWKYAGFKPVSGLRVHVGQIAEWQRTSARSVDRYLDALGDHEYEQHTTPKRGAGFITLRGREKGRLLLDLHDPYEVAKQRGIRAVITSPQLFFDQFYDEDPPALLTTEAPTDEPSEAPNVLLMPGSSALLTTEAPMADAAAAPEKNKTPQPQMTDAAAVAQRLADREAAEAGDRHAGCFARVHGHGHRGEARATPIPHRQPDPIAMADGASNLEQRYDDPVPASQVMLELSRAFDPARTRQQQLAEKEKLARTIKAFCDSREMPGAGLMDPSIAHRAAECVVLGDVLGKRVSRERLKELLDDIDRKSEGGTLRSPGAYFFDRFKRLCGAEDVVWPVSSGRKRK